MMTLLRNQLCLSTLVLTLAWPAGCVVPTPDAGDLQKLHDLGPDNVAYGECMPFDSLPLWTFGTKGMLYLKRAIRTGAEQEPMLMPTWCRNLQGMHALAELPYAGSAENPTAGEAAAIRVAALDKWKEEYPLKSPYRDPSEEERAKEEARIQEDFSTLLDSTAFANLPRTLTCKFHQKNISPQEDVIFSNGNCRPGSDATPGSPNPPMVCSKNQIKAGYRPKLPIVTLPSETQTTPSSPQDQRLGTGTAAQACVGLLVDVFNYQSTRATHGALGSPSLELRQSLAGTEAARFAEAGPFDGAVDGITDCSCWVDIGTSAKTRHSFLSRQLPPTDDAPIGAGESYGTLVPEVVWQNLDNDDNGCTGAVIKPKRASRP